MNNASPNTYLRNDHAKKPKRDSYDWAHIIILGLTGAAAIAAAAFTGYLVWLGGDTAKRQLRAYLTASKAQLDSVNDQGEIKGRFHFENTGQTPAYDVHCWHNIGWRPLPLVESSFPTPPDAATWESRSVLGSGDGSTNGASTLGPMPTVMPLYRTGMAAAVLHGKCIYKDIYGTEHFTTFRFFHTSSMADHLFRMHRGGNEAD